MNEKDIGKKLLAGEDPIDFQMLTHRALQRDRRRMWFLAAACVAAWMLVVIIPWMTILPMIGRIVENQQRISGNTSVSTKEQQEQTMLLMKVVKGGTVATLIGSVSSMFAAAVCTVSLVILSRRATLRQTNDRLAQISAQLRGLSEGSA
jgi:ABC-type Fe3+ transport system permease subunit